MIGIFDSGYGGLTILKEIVKILPEYDYLYLGDNARAPYGNHGKETITRFSDEAVRYLFEHGCNLIIFACFTASALALRELQEVYLRNPKSKYKTKKILGVIKPVVEYATAASKNKTIGVVGTKGTVNSKAFETELHALDPSLKIVQKACPLLVPLIEEHWHEKPEAKMILKKYLAPLKSHNIDTLILGCTHYPLMYRDFKKYAGRNVEVVNPGEKVAKSLRDYLQRHPEIEAALSKKGERVILTTDDPDRFREFGRQFAGLAHDAPVQRIALPD